MPRAVTQADLWVLTLNSQLAALKAEIRSPNEFRSAQTATA
jgi:hypothetical protein